MNPCYLILDVNCLAYRAFHSTGDLTYKDIFTGVVFGIFNELVRLEDRFNTDRVVFCFDKGESLRSQILSTYKSSRKKRCAEMDKTQLKARVELHRQIRLLRKSYLKELGFKNVFAKTGYEADDIIASVVKGFKKSEEVVIVSSDQDMYQLLKPMYDSCCDVRIYNPHTKKIITSASFRRDYRIKPHNWVNIKCLAGCSSDDIKGIKGIGEKTAIKFLLHELKDTSVALQRIMQDKEIWERNVKLVRLPFEGTPKFKLQQDEVTLDKWRKLMTSLGMKSLIKYPPIPSRKRRKHV